MPKSQPSKRRRAQRRYIARPGRAHTTAPLPGSEGPATTAPAARPTVATPVPTQARLARYEHIAGDLKRLGTIAGVLLVVLIVLSLVL